MSVEKNEFQYKGAVLEPVHAMKALDLTLILSYWDLVYLFPFGSYGRLNKKCRYKQISNSRSLLLQKGHFQSGLMYRVQCSITRVVYMSLVTYSHY